VCCSAGQAQKHPDFPQINEDSPLLQFIANNTSNTSKTSPCSRVARHAAPHRKDAIIAKPLSDHRPVLSGHGWLTVIVVLCLCLIIHPVKAQTTTATVENTSANAPTPATYQLGEVRITRNNIFDPASGRLGSRLINRLHYTTRESVVEREVWIKPGEPITADDAKELERNLRALDLFSRVKVTLKPSAGTAGVADLDITTHDRLSIVANAGGSFLGGIGEVKFSIGDKNLFGLGHQLVLGYSENTKGELLGSIGYENILVSGPDVYLGARAGQTEEGEFAEILLENRFQQFQDNLSWAVQLDHKTSRRDYYEQGESVAEVPQTRTRLRSNRITRYGQDQRFTRFGPVINVSTTEYGEPLGSAADTIDVPEDDTRYFIGALYARDLIRGYRKIRYLDTLSYEQDVTLSTSAEIAFGLEHLETDSDENTLPLIFLKGGSYHAPSKNSFINFGIGSSVKVDESTLEAWSVSTGLNFYYVRPAGATLAARWFYESAFDRNGLASSQTLGESNGLRGYPAREFNGEQKLLLNLEYRFRTGLEFASIELGGLVFADSGWVGDRGSSEWLDTPLTSVGTGIRIGSPQLLGSSVIRVDLAYPLHSDETRDYSPTFSLALGQVFGFRP